MGLCSMQTMAVRIPTRCIFSLLTASTTKPTPPFHNLKLQTLSTDSSPSRPFTQEFSPQDCDRNLVSLFNLFRRYGFPPLELQNFLPKSHFLLNANASEIGKSLNVLLSLKSSQEFLFSVVYNCPYVLDFEFLKKWQMGISDMKVIDLTPLLLRNILEVSKKFSLGPDDLFRCIESLKGLGLSGGTMTRLLEAYPMVIMMSTDQMHAIVDVLERIGIERNKIDRIFYLFPTAFKSEMKLRRLLDEFKDLGFSVRVIRKEVLSDPRVLGLELGELCRCASFVGSLKCREPIKEKIFREGPFRAAYEVKLKVDCLHKHGLIYRDAFGVLWKEPRVILYEMDDIVKKIEFLVQKMKYDVQWLVEVPEYLGVNFFKQILPRFNVIEYLRSKGGLGDPVDLKALIKPSRLKFYNLYVKPYPECEKLYGRFAGNDNFKNQHPVGMWRLFKPQKFPESMEDVKNIKSFMEGL